MSAGTRRGTARHGTAAYRLDFTRFDCCGRTGKLEFRLQLTEWRGGGAEEDLSKLAVSRHKRGTAVYQWEGSTTTLTLTTPPHCLRAQKLLGAASALCLAKRRPLPSSCLSKLRRNEHCQSLPSPYQSSVYLYSSADNTAGLKTRQNE